jgi:hypothetical protein
MHKMEIMVGVYNVNPLFIISSPYIPVKCEVEVKMNFKWNVFEVLKMESW